MSNHDLEKALEPAPQKKSPAVKYLVFGVAALLIIAGGYWLIQQFLVKGEVEIPLPKEVAKTINENLRLEDGKLGPVRITPDEKPAAPQRQAAGRTEQRPAAAGLLVEPGKSATELAPDEPGAPGEPRRKNYSGSDAVVTLNFSNDLALYLADNFWPQGTHLAASGGPTSSASLGAAGQRYGIELIGFASTRPEGQRDYLRDRSLVLNYVYTPSMIGALTRLYADRFADRLVEAGLGQVRRHGGREAHLTEREVAGMLHFYADYARSAGAALLAYNAQQGAAQVVQRYAAARDATFQADGRFHEARYRVEEARAQQNQRELREAQQAMKTAEQEYRKSMLEQERAREGVLAFMRKGVSRRLDDQELLYIAGWAARRGEGAAPAHQAAASAADYLGRVLDEKAKELE